MDIEPVIIKNFEPVVIKEVDKSKPIVRRFIEEWNVYPDGRMFFSKKYMVGENFKSNVRKDKVNKVIELKIQEDIEEM